MMFIQSFCVVLFSILIISVDSEIHWDCLGANVEKCETIYTKAIKVAAIAGEDVKYKDICSALEDLIQCAQIDCGGEAWDPTDDFLTKMLEYLKATGLCGCSAETKPCAVQLSKKCISAMANRMQTVTDACDYYGVYAACIIDDGPACADETTTTLVEEMRRQIREKMPTVFGSTTVDMCPDWPDL